MNDTKAHLQVDETLQSSFAAAGGSPSTVPRTVLLLCAIIGASTVFVFVQYFFRFSFFGRMTIALDGKPIAAALAVLVSFPLFAWLGARMWRADWALPILLGLSSAAAMFLLFTTALFGGAGLSVPVMFTVAIALLMSSAIPWFTLRRMIKGRAGRSDGRGHIKFLDGGDGRTELRHEGDVVAWLHRDSSTTGYRQDGDGRRYRAVAGTREILVANARRRSAFLVLHGLAIGAVFIAYESVTYFQWAFVYPGLNILQ